MTHRTNRHELHLTELDSRPEPGGRALPAPPRNLRRRGRGIDHAADRHAMHSFLHEIERGADWDDLDAPTDR